MSNLERIQEQLVDNEVLLAELELENTTPVIIGGYNARPYSSVMGLMEEPRPTEIKGMWRWWARALVSGALIESKGVDIGSITEANKVVAYVLGGRIGGELKPSKVLLSIELLSKDVEDLSSYMKRIARLNLIAQGIKSKKELRERELRERFSAYTRLKLRLKVYEFPSLYVNIPASFYEFAISSLLLSLMFSGLGAITTRAFGSVKVRVSKLSKNLGRVQRFRELLNTLYEKDLDVGKAKDIVSEVVDLALESSLNYLNDLVKHFNLKISGSKVGNLPSIPSVVKSYSNMFRLEVLSCKSTDVYQVLSTIGKSVLKQKMKEMGSPCFGVGRTASGAHIHTFIIGLPRSSEIFYGNLKLRTGYIVLKQSINKPQQYHRSQVGQAINAVNADKTGRLRRISTIGFTVLRNKPMLILVYGMLAKDIDLIKKDLVHRGVHGKTGRSGFVNKIVDTPLSNVNVVDEFNKLWNCVMSILMKQC